MARIFVGMSGGVDSTAAAALLIEQGHEVTGITLKLWDDASRCCDYEDILDAKRACWKLGIKHYVLNLKKDFKKKIVDYFISEYINGRTPNPCVLCNEEIKFAALIKKMKEHNYDHVATGHYAVIENNKGVFSLKKAADKKKTQEYFLSRLKKESLKYIKFPLGKMTKEKARLVVKKYGLKSDKAESQEVCFLKEGESPFEFIERHVDIKKTGRGGLYHTDGGKIKDLDYAYFKYTVGQRKGLGVGGGGPLYVASIDAEKKRVIAGPRETVYRKTFEAGDLNMFQAGRKNKFRADVKIRYLSRPAKAKIEINGRLARVVFDEPQFAVTPGQLAVFYRGATVIGSGFIL
jgi:tRNA-specific 2-thiouridylase